MEKKGNRLYRDFDLASLVQACVMSGIPFPRTILAPRRPEPQFKNEFFKAVAKGTLKEVQEWLEAGVSINQVDENGETVLAKAAKRGSFEIVEFLLKKGASFAQEFSDVIYDPVTCFIQVGNVEAVKKYANTFKDDAEKQEELLFVACYAGHMNIVAYLFEDLKFSAESEDALLMCALMQGNEDVAFYLEDKFGQISYAVMAVFAGYGGSWRLINHYIQKAGDEKDQKTAAENVVRGAIKKGRLDIVKHFVEKGIVPIDTCLSSFDGEEESSLLQVAVESNQFEVFTYLVKNDAKIDKKLLGYAARVGNLSMFTCLLEKDSSGLRVRDSLYGREPIATAAASGRLDIIKYMFEKQSNLMKLFFKDKKGNTLGHHVAYSVYAACEKDNRRWISLLDYLFEKGLKVNEPNLQGDTMLHEATRLNNSHIMRYLLFRGADISQVNCKGKRPVQIAHDEGRILLEYVEAALKRSDEQIAQQIVEDAFNKVTSENALTLARYLKVTKPVLFNTIIGRFLDPKKIETRFFMSLIVDNKDLLAVLMNAKIKNYLLPALEAVYRLRDYSNLALIMDRVKVSKSDVLHICGVQYQKNPRPLLKELRKLCVDQKNRRTEFGEKIIGYCYMSQYLTGTWNMIDAENVKKNIQVPPEIAALIKSFDN